MMLLTTLAAVLIGTVGVRIVKARRRRATIVELQNLEGQVGLGGSSDPIASLLERVLGTEDFTFRTVESVVASGTKIAEKDNFDLLLSFPYVRFLELSRTGVTDSQLERLVASNRVVTLNLDNTRIQSLKWLQNFPELEILRCLNTEITDQSLEYLAHTPNLRGLYLVNTKLTDGVATSISDVTFNDLRSVDLSSTRVGDRTLEVIASHAGITRLGLKQTDVTNDGAVSLRKLKSLRSLNLSDTEISDRGLENIGELKGLTKLNLEGTATTDAGLRHLTNLTSLEDLNLESTRVRGTKFEYLTELGQLKTLSLYNAPVTDLAVESLLRMGSLKTLVLWNTEMSSQAIDQLKNSLSSTNVTESEFGEQ